ncbi:hypothetical protein N658DRAFT_518265 [Parathielavia hyrcaniae]|uniref:F-box domain-containing protein n=1 Tax=Parathielavia hyrcaniae TaxID=113614 RepID=A0AAN6SYE8_9PEZI|nr:hypothetical protein N658DRAFT_518265 [Parathielavia hyrcaniae]
MTRLDNEGAYVYGPDGPWQAIAVRVGTAYTRRLSNGLPSAKGEFVAMWPSGGGLSMVPTRDAGGNYTLAESPTAINTTIEIRLTAVRLALSLVFDVDPQHPLALHLAESILAPLFLHPRSHLSECRIRLAKTPDGGPLQQLAQDAAVYACGLPPVPYAASSATATLASLPRELRVRILEYTDLVAPRRQVAWSRQDCAYVLLRLRRGVEPPYANLDHLYDAKFFECYRARPQGCFCRRRHAAFSSHCTCWAPPGPSLFLVCRALSQDAQYVFFSRNRFIIHDYKTWPVWRLPDSPEGNSYPFERFAASEFLRDVVPVSALAHLRFLELPGSEHAAARDWLATVSWLRDRLNRPALTLRVIVMDESNGAPDRDGEATADKAAALLRAYVRLVRPLRGLAAEPPGLARFYTHFRYPRQRPWDGLPNAPPRPGPCLQVYADIRKEPAPSDWDYMSFDSFP